jgi:8-oxo-dGTP pyrophosphatase MutT (NUDIX family)
MKDSKVGTVCFVIDQDRVLLAQIQYPDGRLLWNGIGGIVDPGETPKEAAVREIGEETKIAVDKEFLTEVHALELGELTPHVYVSRKWSGELVTIDPTLKQLRWFAFDDVPYSEMHDDNDVRLSKILSDFVTDSTQ